MSDLLRQGSQWLGGMLKQYASRPVTYRRGETDLAVDATVGRTQYEVEDGYGLRVAAEVMDFLILAEDFTLGEPQAGDQIVVDSTVYEVMALGTTGHWRWSDPHHTTLRIHTKEIGPDE
jgi:hypothetical protein